MAFSYAPDHADAVSRVRFALGDTAEAGRLVEDETIAAEVAARGEEGAIAALAGGLAARLARQPDAVAIPGGPSVSFSRVKALQSAAERAKAASGGGGGATASRAAIRDDDERRPEYRAPEGFPRYGG